MEARDHDRSKLIIATKCGNHDIKGNVNAPGLSRHNIIRSVEDSLKRLKTSYIDILYTHVWDEGTPLAETLATLNSLVEQGKVRYIGASNLTGWQLQLASIQGSKLTMGGYMALQQQVREASDWSVLGDAVFSLVNIFSTTSCVARWSLR